MLLVAKRLITYLIANEKLSETSSVPLLAWRPGERCNLLAESADSLIWSATRQRTKINV